MREALSVHSGQGFVLSGQVVYRSDLLGTLNVW